MTAHCRLSLSCASRHCRHLSRCRRPAITKPPHYRPRLARLVPARWPSVCGGVEAQDSGGVYGGEGVGNHRRRDLMRPSRRTTAILLPSRPPVGCWQSGGAGVTQGAGGAHLWRSNHLHRLLKIPCCRPNPWLLGTPVTKKHI